MSPPSLKRIALFSLATFVILVASCGDDDDDSGGLAPGDTQPPVVQSSSPSAGATGVSLLPRIGIKFSEPMDAATITAETITLELAADQGTEIPARVDYIAADRLATCIPDSTLAGETSYTLTCSSEARDLAGNGFAEPWSLSFTTGPLDCDHLADLLESNDEISKATPATIGETYRSLTHCGEDRDLFAVTLADTVKLWVTQTLRAAAADHCVILLTRADGETYSSLGYLGSSGHTQSFGYSFLPGTYYAHVYTEYEPDYVLYDLELTTSEPCKDDGYEDNDFADEAKPIGTGTLDGLHGCFVDADWFAIDATAGQSLTVTVRNEPITPETHRRLIIEDPSGTELVHVDGEDNPLTRTVDVTSSGTHRIMARFWSDGVDYRLTVSLAD